MENILINLYYKWTYFTSYRHWCMVVKRKFLRLLVILYLQLQIFPNRTESCIWNLFSDWLLAVKSGREWTSPSLFHLFFSPSQLVLSYHLFFAWYFDARISTAYLTTNYTQSASIISSTRFMFSNGDWVKCSNWRFTK